MFSLDCCDSYFEILASVKSDCAKIARQSGDRIDRLKISSTGRSRAGKRMQAEPVTIQVVVKRVNSLDLTIADIDTQATIAALKACIESQHNIERGLQRLIFNGAELKDEEIIGSVGIHNAAILHMAVRKKTEADVTREVGSGESPV